MLVACPECLEPKYWSMFGEDHVDGVLLEPCKACRASGFDYAAQSKSYWLRVMNPPKTGSLP